VIISPGATYGNTQLTSTPLGKRLVIEYLSIKGSVPTGQFASEATLLGTSAGSSAIFRFGMAPRPKTHSHIDTFGLNEHVRVNVRSTAGVIVTVARGEATTGYGNFNVALSGYLVDE
jgi:hypothetical protein